MLIKTGHPNLVHGRDFGSVLVYQFTKAATKDQQYTQLLTNDSPRKKEDILFLTGTPGQNHDFFCFDELLMSLRKLGKYLTR